LSLFVDTSALFAAADRSDAHNARAKQVLASGERLVTSDHVLVELWILTARRLGQRSAERQWRAIRRGAATLEPVGAADLEVAWSIGEEFADQGFSLVDRTSFAVMHRLGITRAATFDDHFAVYRFGPRRSRAFEVVR
jgi:predicted nucleic acid-binding protein